VTTQAKILLTHDEARRLVAASGLRLVERLRCDKRRLRSLLWGRARATGLSEEERARMRAHQEVVVALSSAGLGWVVDEEMEGILSLTSGGRDAR
jgi:hypothetical protein